MFFPDRERALFLFFIFLFLVSGQRPKDHKMERSRGSRDTGMADGIQKLTGREGTAGTLCR